MCMQIHQHTATEHSLFNNNKLWLKYVLPKSIMSRCPHWHLLCSLPMTPSPQRWVRHSTSWTCFTPPLLVLSTTSACLLASQDEWVASDYTQDKLEALKKQKELVNLIIGWRRYKLEAEATQKQKSELTEQLKALKESTKTPEDRIKELEAKLADLDAEEQF